MAKRLIDADALMEHIKDLPTWWPDEGSYYMESMKYPQGMFEPDDIISSIENAPTVEAVEVVRCKDCHRFVDNKEARVTYCRRSLKDMTVRPDDFCSYGERRSDGTA